LRSPNLLASFLSKCCPTLFPRCWPARGQCPAGRAGPKRSSSTGSGSTSDAMERGLLAFTRGRDCTAEFPELASIAGRHRVLLDGELVCLGADSPPLSRATPASRLPFAEPRGPEAGRAPATLVFFDDARSERACGYSSANAPASPFAVRRLLLVRVRVLSAVAAAEGLPAVVAAVWAGRQRINRSNFDRLAAIRAPVGPCGDVAPSRDWLSH
jgi:hypothetical protein